MQRWGTSKNQYSAFWVGLDGLGPSPTVEQTGTESNCVGPTPQYYAWYEFYPNPQVVISGITITPGDQMSASVVYIGSNKAGPEFTLTITDVTTGQSFTTTAVSAGAARTSAEWIAEAPSSSNTVLPLADFGTALFGQDSTGVTGTNYATDSAATNLPIGQFPAANLFRLTMVNSSSVAIATPSQLTSDGTSFSVGSGAQPMNFGAINVCTLSQTTPAPCNKTLTLSYNVAAATTFKGAPQVVTQGTQKLDFTLGSGGSTCTGAVPAGTSCFIDVTFAPLAPGLRMGAVQLFDNSGNLPLNTLVYGIGQAPAIAFDEGAPQLIVGSGFSNPSGVTVGAAGDVFVVDAGNSRVEEQPAGGGAQSTVNISPYVTSQVSGVAVDGAGDVFISGEFILLPSGIPTIGVLEVPSWCSSCAAPVGSGFSAPFGLAVDGAGDIFVADLGLNQVVEISASGAQTMVGSGLSSPTGVAVDAAGDVFIADSGNNRVVEVPAGGGAQTTVGSGFSTPISVAVDAAGDVFITDAGNNRVEEVQAGGGAQSTVILQNYPLNAPFGVAVDGAGDVFISNDGGNQVVEAERSRWQQTFSYANTPVGATSTDSPQSIIVQNFGNQTLTGSLLINQVEGANFLQVAGSGTPSDCPASFTLTPGESCNVSISFEPKSIGALASGVAFTDNTLNTDGSAKQAIQLSGNGTSPTPPTFSPIGGTYNSAQSVMIMDASPGAAIYYTTDGTMPTTGSAKYTAPIPVSQTETLEAIAVVSETPNSYASAVASATYTIQATVPNVVGDTQAAATTAITGAGLVVGTVTTATSTTVAAGNVISESPAAGIVVAPESAVNLVVSVGPTSTAAVVSVTPTPATGLSNTFVLTYSDTGGYANLNHVGVIFNPAANASNSCYVLYYPSSNALVLMNNAGTGYTAIAPGSGTLSNSQCTITGSGSSVTKSGDTLTLNLAVTVSSTYTGKQNIFMYADDVSSANTGWVNKGTWTPAADQAPAVVSVSPTPATGLSNTFALTYSDPNGASDLDVVEAVFSTAVSGANSCFVLYYPATNVLYLLNNAGTGTTKITPGSGTLSNSQCTISGSGTTVVRSGDTLTLNLAITASSTYTGAKNIFMFAEDNSAAKTSYVNKGTWTP